MYFTSFFPIFMLAVAWALRGPVQWAQATAFMAFFQASAPVLLAMGGRAVGLAPAYMLLPIVLIHLIRQISPVPVAREQKSIALEVWLLGYFTLIGSVGAVLLPRLFASYVKVLPTRFGLDSGFVIPLKPETTNYLQAIYLIFNLCLVIAPITLHKKGFKMSEGIIIGTVAGAVVSALLGFYQVLAYHTGLPWPSDVINSNWGLKQLEDQTMFGFKRMSSTFLEPALLALHFLAAFGLMMLGQKRWKAGVIVLLALLLSTSSTAYVGFILMMTVWMALNYKTLNAQTFKVAAAVVLLVGIVIGADLFTTGGQYAENLLLKKMSAGSGEVRLNADALAWQSLRDSFGMGVGVGSLRASSLIATLFASVGIPAALCFAGFIGMVLFKLSKSPNPNASGLLFCMIGVLSAWAISIPDWSMPVFWLIAGAAIIEIYRKPADYLEPAACKTPAAA
jgi:hypothetical protein